MKKLLLCAALMAGSVCSFAQLNMSLLGQLDYQALHNTELNDVWGWVEPNTGTEYALVGAQKGTSIVDVSDPANPVEVFWEQGSNSVWRDLKTWNNHAYVTTEGGDGLLIIDLSTLPGNTNLTTTQYFGPGGNQWASAHDLYIDENGICYIFGADRGEGGAIMLDLTIDPMNPVEVGDYDDFYIHDGVAYGDTLYAGHISDGFFTIVDVSNKANPVILATQQTPHLTTHNIWVSDNRDFVFTTDEVSQGTLAAYDISNLTNITEVDRIQDNPNSTTIPHNTHYINDYIVTSYYRSGVMVHDVSHPDNIIEVGQYDTSPSLSDNGFNGCWGVYPWLPSGNIIATDIELGLYVIAPTYIRGCYLEGKVTDINTTLPINGVDVQIVNQIDGVDATDLSGDYGTGLAQAGTYDVTFYEPTYLPKTVTGVVLNNGVVTVEDVQLTPKTPFTLTITVQEMGTGTPLANAEVVVENPDFSYSGMTDGAGVVTFTPFYDGMYQITGGIWGHVQQCTYEVFTAGNNSYTVELEPGYYDDFALDYGWVATDNGEPFLTGQWERGEPVGVEISAGVYTNPEFDVTNDCSDKVYVTGNSGGGIGSDDVDRGQVVLTSPIFDATTYSDPYISYARWWFNTNNDTLQFMLTNGITTVSIEMLDTSYLLQSQWVDTSIRIMDHITPTANMQFIVITADFLFPGPGDQGVVEAAIDKFFISEGNILAVSNITIEPTITAYPNPFANDITINYDLNKPLRGNAEMVIYDVTGRIIYRKGISQRSGSVNFSENVGAGMYLVSIVTEELRTNPIKISKL
jgi:choice-of-anchor B domain-containing protein